MLHIERNIIKRYREEFYVPIFFFIVLDIPYLDTLLSESTDERYVTYNFSLNFLFFFF